MSIGRRRASLERMCLAWLQIEAGDEERGGEGWQGR